jgi:hypothetical protein
MVSETVWKEFWLQDGGRKLRRRLAIVSEDRRIAPHVIKILPYYIPRVSSLPRGIFSPTRLINRREYVVE